jgi:hypothetical protein
VGPHNGGQAAGAAQAAGTVGSANALGGGIGGASQGYMLSQILSNKYPSTTGGTGYYNTNQFMGPMPQQDGGGGFSTDNITYA